MKARIRKRPKRGQSASPRSVAARALVSWISADPSSRGPLSRIINDFLGQIPPQDPRDRALARELTFGVVRHLSLLEYRLGRFLRSGRRLHPVVRVHLLLGAYQILFLDRIPQRAAVDEAVKAVRSSGQAWACGVVNAVLRKLAERKEKDSGNEAAVFGGRGLSPVEVLSLETSHPAWMVQRWVDRYGLQVAGSLCRTNNLPASVVLRVNRIRISRDNAVKLLEDAGIAAEKGLFSRDAVRLPDFRGDPSLIPGFETGLFQVQDEASQMAALLLSPMAGEKVLDACAGPGGKTTHLAEIAGDNASIDAIDPSGQRLDLLRENVRRLGIRSITVLNYERFMRESAKSAGMYQKVLVDAPCSGLGVIRRHPDIKWNRSAEGISELSRIQARCLRDFSKMVAPGGELVYSVCTMEPEETSRQIEVFLSENPEWRVINAGERLDARAGKFITGEGYLMILPESHGPDGFFAALLTKTR